MVRPRLSKRGGGFDHESVGLGRSDALGGQYALWKASGNRKLATGIPVRIRTQFAQSRENGRLASANVDDDLAS